MSATAPNLYLLPSPRAAEAWLTAEQVMTVTGWSRRTFFRNCDELLSRESGRIGPNGRPVREYLAASLPADAAAKLAGESIPTSASASQLGSDASGAMVPYQGFHAPLFAGHTSAAALMRVALPNPAHQAQAEERLAILDPILSYHEDPRRYAALRLRDGSAVTSKSKLVRYQAEQTGNGERTLKLWLSRYAAGGFPALADRQRSDKNTSRWFAEHEQAADIVAYLYLKCQQSRRVCYETLIRQAPALGIAEDDLPSYETVRAFLKLTPPYLEAFARRGRRAYREGMAPYLAAAYVDLSPNEVWVIDHMIHDVEVMNDSFPELPWGAPMRLRCTAIMDRRSRFFVGLSWCPEGSSRSIATSLRRALSLYPPPRTLYRDNGKDLRRVAKGAIPARLSDPAAIRGWIDTQMQEIENIGLLGRLGIRDAACLPHHPQSKNIERNFGTMHNFDKYWYRHYTGGAPHLRPDATEAAMMLHRKLARHGRVENSTHPRSSVFIACCMVWVDTVYHQTPHSGEGMDGRTPAEVFAEREPGHPAPQESLAMLFFEHERRRVRECAVELHGRRYTYEESDKAARDVLHEANGKDVMVAWDPNDPLDVAIVDDAGHFLCWARQEEKIDFDPADPEVRRRIAESMSDRRHLEKATRQLVDDIARNARAAGAETPVEALVKSSPVPQLVAPVLTHRAAKTANNSPVQPPAQPMTPAEAARLLLERRKG